MKKLFKTFVSFISLALLVEVVILISTKVTGWDNFANGRPFLAAVHVHLMVLGAIFFLVQIVLEKQFSITSTKLYNVFYIIYIVGLSLNVSMMLYKGFAQIFDFAIIRAITEACSAIAHISLFVAFFMFVYCLYQCLFKNKQNKVSAE